ncbi:MAG TPA: hypothetical protein VHQ24_17725 [Lachnospiraceae bacterium]|nr:hypothetical protein [Lachnospiraceae bacterium]
MKRNDIEINDFTRLLNEATNELRSYEMEKSYQRIMEAFTSNPNAPEPHNLLGIWYEIKNDSNLARKHYRAAYALDPSYKPASRNLERVCTFFSSDRSSIDYGDRSPEGSRKETILERMRRVGSEC